MTSVSHLRLFVGRELADAVRARWFLVYSGIFLLGGFLLIALGARDTMVAGYRGYARALAGLIHFAIVFVPLMAVFPACAALAEPRENGTLEYVLAQPVGWGEVFLGKWAGVTLAVTLAITTGYLFAGGLAALRGVPGVLVWASYGYLLLLAAAFVSLGLGLSAISETRSRAVTLGLLSWLALVSLGSIGAMAAFVRAGAPSGLLVAWSFLNPVEAFRLATITLLDPDLGLLGPVGASLAARHGPSFVRWIAAGSLLSWTAIPLWLGTSGILRRRDGA